MSFLDYVSKEVPTTPTTLTPELAKGLQQKFAENFPEVVTWQKSLELSHKEETQK